MQSAYCSTSYKNLSFHVLPTENPTAFGIPNDSIAFLNKRSRILTSSQGLLVIRDMQNNRISLCNPVTKTVAPIPYPGNVTNIIQLCTDGFVLRFRPGTLNFPDDYAFIATVFVEIKDDPWKSGPHLAVYSKGKWSEYTCDLRGKPGEVRHHHPVGLFCGPNNGLVVHYLYDSLPNALRNPVYLEPYVGAYDIETMTLWMKVNLPTGAWLRDGDHQLLDIFNWGIGESLGLVRTDRRRLTVWVLEKYTPVRWRKVVEKTVSEMGVPEEEGDVAACAVVNGTGLLFATSNKVYCYEMEGPNAGRFDVVGNHGLHEQEYGFGKWIS